MNPVIQQHLEALRAECTVLEEVVKKSEDAIPKALHSLEQVREKVEQNPRHDPLYQKALALARRLEAQVARDKALLLENRTLIRALEQTNKTE